ncbi:MAG: DUF6476 family protein [Rubritepida sp.]|jgi:hypothetical protein|nr:DUF6476 family protein [Rubritepida sp.]
MQALKGLVVAMGVLIVAGTVALVVLIIQRAGGREAARLPPIALDMPAGARIAGVAGAGDRFALLVQGPAGERVIFLDARSGRVVGEAVPAAR